MRLTDLLLHRTLESSESEVRCTPGAQGSVTLGRDGPRFVPPTGGIGPFDAQLGTLGRESVIAQDFVNPTFVTGLEAARFEVLVFDALMHTARIDRRNPLTIYGTSALMALFGGWMSFPPASAVMSHPTHLKILAEVAKMPETPEGYDRVFKKLNIVHKDNPHMPDDFLLLLGKDAGCIFTLGGQPYDRRPPVWEALVTRSPEPKHTYVLDPQFIVGVELRAPRKSSWQAVDEGILED